MKNIKTFVIKFLKKIGFNIVQIRGFVQLRLYDANGTLLQDTGFQENGITSVGLAALAGLGGNVGSVTAFGYMELGSGSTAFNASQTALVTAITNHGLDRAAATVTRSTSSVTNDTLQFDHTWTASGGSSDNILEIGIFNASSSGVMLARKVTTSTAVASGQSLAVTYKVIFA